ncbi:MAG: PD-(D/E)XK nuclease family protein, partial [Sphingomonadaceae bacterium]
GDRPRPHSARDLRAALPDALASWLDGALARLEPLGLPGPAGLDRWAAALAEALGRLAGEALWQEEDGRTLRDLLERLMADGASLEALGAGDAATVIDQALALVTVRPAPGQSDPRIAIRGLIEARLQAADVLVLGGLNEGVWPGAPTPDPWLAPFARRALGLPDEASRVALAAHDLGMLIESRADLLLTRARRDAAGPTVPSRFWLRLEAAGLLRPTEEWRDWARALDLTPGLPRPAARPAPRPPAQLRPRRISASRLDTLRADPFAIFAADILGLRRLPWLDEPLGAAERGTAVHAALSCWLLSGAPAGALAGALGEALGRWLAAEPATLALERPRLARAADWVEAQVARRRAQGWRFAASEESAAMALIGEVQLKGRADWVEVHADGGLAVIDFKTGQVPSATMLREGFATQLGLLGALLEDRAGQGSRVAELAYWRLGGGLKEPGEIRDVLATKEEGSRKQARWSGPSEFIAFCVAEARETARRYLLGGEPFLAKARPDFARMGDDFDHLARVDEWIAALGRPPADSAAP